MTKITENTLSTKGMTDLLLSKDKFTFVCKDTGQEKYNGATMLYLVFEKIDPNTVVGLDGILKKLEKAKLSDFGNDVSKMLTAI